MKNEITLTEYLKRISAILVLIPLQLMLKGLVLCQLWSWFIVSTFNVDSLRVVEAIGIALMASFLTAKKAKKVKESKFWINFKDRVRLVIGFPLFILFIGWVVQMFM